MRSAGGYDVVLLADRSADRARTAAAKLRIPRWEAVSDITEVAPEAEVHAVTCGTAPFAHHEVVRSALDAGKHAITEKPFAMTVEQGEELRALAADRRLVLAVVHNF